MRGSRPTVNSHRKEDCPRYTKKDDQWSFFLSFNWKRYIHTRFVKEVSVTNLIEIVLIAIGLAMDAFAVSITSGTIIQKMRLRHAVRIALFFGFFQAMMPILGWLGGTLFSEVMETYDHWIAFVLLTLIGGKMFKEVFDEGDEASFNPLDVYVLFTLAVATSIDALAVGVTFSILDMTIWWAALIIGVITFGFSLLGVFLGKSLGEKLGNRVEIFGGVILIGIGTKILVEHLFFM